MTCPWFEQLCLCVCVYVFVCCPKIDAIHEWMSAQMIVFTLVSQSLFCSCFLFARSHFYSIWFEAVCEQGIQDQHLIWRCAGFELFVFSALHSLKLIMGVHNMSHCCMCFVLLERPGLACNVFISSVSFTFDHFCLVHLS